MKILILVMAVSIFGCNKGLTQEKEMAWNPLTPVEKRVIAQKDTERPFTGAYTHHKESGTFLCKRCNAPLYRSVDKFDAHCGWPAFALEIDKAVKRIPDPDGRRTEIVCATCDGHLGHVFLGEAYTKKNTRHCVNSVSMRFVPAEVESRLDRAIFASGCFWGTEYHLQKLEGVIDTTVGYTGGHVDSPTYEQVCSARTGHAEAVEVFFDPTKVSFEILARLFFETHDPTLKNRQGPDIGPQYRSEIFCLDNDQTETAEKLIEELRVKGYDVATKITQASVFWEAENYHQDYYINEGQQPYCHAYTKKF